MSTIGARLTDFTPRDFPEVMGACQRWSLVGGLHGTVGIHWDGIVGTQLPPPSLLVPE